MHWLQRSGSVVTVIGGYVAYIDARQSVKFIDDNMYLNSHLPYKAVAIVLVFLGTLVWGYADLWV